MKEKNEKNRNPRKILIILMTMFVLVVFLSVVSAMGVSYPYPQNIELKPGQASYFTFQIQQLDNYQATCIPIVEDKNGLEFAFNQEYVIEPNQNYEVKPQVIVPQQTGFGSYTAKFCIQCTPSTSGEGSRVISRICGLPVSVNVVSERTGVNALEPTPKATIGFVTILIFLSFSILLLAAVIFYLVIRRRNKK